MPSFRGICEPAELQMLSPMAIKSSQCSALPAAFTPLLSPVDTCLVPNAPTVRHCHLQSTMPIELWDDHLIPFLTLNEAVALAELCPFFYRIVHEHVQLRSEASLVCPVLELLRVLSKWRNLRNMAFQPVGDDQETGRVHESIHYNVNAAGGLVVDLEQNQPAPEPEPTQGSYTDEDGVSVPMRYICPKILRDFIQGDDVQVKR